MTAPRPTITFEGFDTPEVPTPIFTDLEVGEYFIWSCDAAAAAGDLDSTYLRRKRDRHSSFQVSTGDPVDCSGLVTAKVVRVNVEEVVTTTLKVTRA